MKRFTKALLLTAILSTCFSLPTLMKAQADTASSVLQQDETLIASNPTDSTYYEDLGQVYEQMGDSNVHIFVDGKQPYFDLAPYITGGRVMTPIRAVMESLSLGVAWNPDTRQVTLTNGRHEAVLTINSNQAIVDGVPMTLDVPAAIVYNRTVVPLRFISEAFGAQVGWYPYGQVVSINLQASSTTTTTTTTTSNSALIKVPAISQKPELYNGCEATSMTMLLNWAGKSIDKLQVASDLPKDTTPVQYDANGNITAWGDPNDGFVGDVTGKGIGYAIYHQPMYTLLNQYVPGRAVDLTGDSFSQILAQLQAGKPVMAWTTASFQPTNNWVTWQGPNGTVKATFDEHCVLLVGYDQNQNLLYINDPLDGTAGKAIPLDPFKQAWEQLGSQALSVK